MRRFSTLLAVTLGAIALWLVAAGVDHDAAEAHGNLARSDPAANSALGTSPRTVTIWFTEPIAPTLSSIRVLNSEGLRVDNGDYGSLAGDLTSLTVSLPTLPRGTYTVAWSNLSAVDGHRINGFFAFAVGEPLDTAAVAEAEDPPLFQSPFDPIARGIALWAGLSALGSALFGLLVARPAFADISRGRSGPSRYARVTEVLQRLTLIALGIWILATLLQLAVQGAITADVPLYRFAEAPLGEVLTDTDWGHAWLVRAAFLALAAWVAVVGRRAARAPEVVALALIGALAGYAYASHSAAISGMRVPGLITDTLHLVAASTWSGGLLAFVVTLVLVRWMEPAAPREVLAALTRRFSLLAGASVAVLVVTGVYETWLHVHVAEAFDTAYGRTLLVKLGLVAAMIALAAINLLWVRPHLHSDSRAAIWLRRLVAGEALLGVLVIASVGILTGLEPGRDRVAAEQTGREFRTTIDGVTTSLLADPGVPGENRFEIRLTDANDRPIDATLVELKLAYTHTDIGELTLPAAPLGDGRFEVTGARLSLIGNWQAEVYAQRPDGFDIRSSQLVPIGDAGATEGLPMSSARWFWVALWLTLGAAGWALAWLQRGTARATLQWAGSSSLVVAALVIGQLPPLQFNAPHAGPSVNPLPASAAVLERGAALYAAQCVQCHGDAGNGDGPRAGELEFPPANLNEHVPYHTDRQLFAIIAGGVPARGMPAFAGTLTDEEIWSLMHELRRLTEVGATPDAGS